VRASACLVARLTGDPPQDQMRPCWCKVHQIKPRRALRVSHGGGGHVWVERQHVGAQARHVGHLRQRRDEGVERARRRLCVTVAHGSQDLDKARPRRVLRREDRGLRRRDHSNVR
jgi:hypothetical protein